jgi:twitching motility protein PilT
MIIDNLLKELVEKGGSDLHIKALRPPLMRINGELSQSYHPAISKDEIRAMIYPMLSELQAKKLEEDMELDFSYHIEGVARFRCNIFFQMGNLGAAFRLIPVETQTLEALKLPPVLNELTQAKQGIILVTGPTGSGKSTTLSAIIDRINETRCNHIITIEDPVEFVHSDKKCTINQREVYSDTKSFTEALRRALRQDPDIILVGEMRDPETISIAMTAAETGHLVLSTLHTNDAKQSIDRIIDTFPPDQQHQVRMQLAMTIKAVISQKLIKDSSGEGRIAVVEVMINTPTIRKLVEEGKTGMIDKTIADSSSLYKMQTQNQHLLQLVKENVLTQEDAINASKNPNDLRIMLQTKMQTAETKADQKTPSGAKTSLGRKPSPFGSESNEGGGG